jgi:glycolate oxidase
VITQPGSLLVYESDGLTAYRARPLLVVLPRGYRAGGGRGQGAGGLRIPFVARGAGTGLSGGALALDNAAVISTPRMRRILDSMRSQPAGPCQPGS